tara:strand:+ start:1754 stop:2800 length:1047 start_codon:yes stop_codon:yes gene_type:complete
MKNFTQKFIGLLALAFTMCFTVNTQAQNNINLPQGWSIFGYNCEEPQEVTSALNEIADKIVIVKDHLGNVYVPELDFNGISDFTNGVGYQIKMIEQVDGFQFCSSVLPEDGIGQADVDASYENGVASVDITSDNQAAFDEGAASVTPEDGITQADVDAAILATESNYLGWCQSDIDNDGVCDADEVSGCMEATACNYIVAAEFDDGSCNYPNEGYDCNGNLLQIGDITAGGIIFQINEDGTGLVADLEDLGLMEWWDALSAADSSTSQGYDDWYLPSIDELGLMYNTLGNGGSEGNIGGFETSDYPRYWSSLEAISNSNHAWCFGFNNGSTSTFYKDNSFSVRCVRAF